MKPFLFRLKIALLSFLISGTVLLVFGVFFLAGIHKVGMDRIDREIRALGESQIRGRHPKEFWAGFDRSLGFIYGDDLSSRIFVQVRDEQGYVIFSSDNCPAKISELLIPMMPFIKDPRESAGARAPYVSQERRPPPRHRRASLRPPPHSDRGFISRLDQDGDQQVSRDEFDGPDDVFSRHDRNRNGYIDKAEVVDLQPPDHAEGIQPFAHLRESLFQTMELSSNPWRVGIMGNESVTIIIGMTLSDFYADADRFQRAFLIVTPLALLLLAAAGWLLASRAMRPVGIISRTAQSISAHELNKRIPAVSADAELAQLVDVINGMLERLERSYKQAIRFSGDAAHELQTPLTVIQGELDNAVQAAEDGSSEQQWYSQLLEEVQRLKMIMQKLLLLARADAGRLKLKREPVNFSELLISSVEDVEAITSSRSIEQHIEPHVRVSADRQLLEQLVRNMTSNAVKYGEENGLIRFELFQTKDVVRFTLTNSGQPISAEDRALLFERFHRVDKVRNRDAGGSGLGLSLAREIARAHGGTLVLNPDVNGLISFTLTMTSAD